MSSVLAEADLADPSFWNAAPQQRLDTFASLRRREAPVYFGPPGRGFHALVRHRDVVEASRHPEIFLSGPGVTTPRPPRWVRTVFGDSMVNLDDPRHARLRGVVGRAFTPRVVARITADVTRVACAIVDEVSAQRPADFVEAVAGRLPFEVICTMMGIPEGYRREVLDQVNHTTEGAGVRRRRLRVPGKSLRALARLHRVVGRVARERRREPVDDLISALVTAEVDGGRLNSRELGSFFSLLLVAGVETTRNAIAHGLHLLTVNPEQRELLVGDFDGHVGGFVDEVVRYSSPIIQFRRTLACDYELGRSGRTQAGSCPHSDLSSKAGPSPSPHAGSSHPAGPSRSLLGAGEDVVLFYASANRDESVFDRPDEFDITRRPNPHVGFGGGGPHFCLGTSLARQEITVLFRELLTRLPEIRSVGEPELAPSSFDNRVAHLRFTC